MRIELLKTTPDRAGRYYVKFEDDSSMRLYRQTVEDFALYTGKELSEEELDALREHAGRMSAKMRAVRIVAASNVSKRDLEERLVHKGETPEQAREAVQWMTDLDLLDDAKVAEQVVSRCISRGYGIARARQALYEKRIPKEFWEEALAGYPDQETAITKFLAARLDETSSPREVKRAVDALLHKGHSYGTIRKCLQQILSGCTETESVWD